MTAEWKPGSVVPLRPDVYKREYADKGRVDIVYCYWNGKVWGACADDPESAKTVSVESPNQNLPWSEITPETTELRVA